jgi:hypothetical protein
LGPAITHIGELPPGRNEQGEEQNTVVFLKRLSGGDDMIGRP